MHSSYRQALRTAVFCVLGFAAVAAQPELIYQTATGVFEMGPVAMTDADSGVQTKLDHCGKMVAIEAKIIVVEDNFLEDIGVDWDIAGVGKINAFQNPALSIIEGANEVLLNVELERESVVGQALLGFNLDTLGIDFYLDAMDDSFGVLSAPKLTVLNGTRAEIQVGESIPFVSGLVTDEATDDPPQFFTAADIGVELKITPTIVNGVDHYITLNILPNIPFIKAPGYDGNGFTLLSLTDPQNPPGDIPVSTRVLVSNINYDIAIGGLLEVMQSDKRVAASSPTTIQLPGFPDQTGVIINQLFEMKLLTPNLALGAGFLEQGLNGTAAAFISIVGDQVTSSDPTEADIDGNGMTNHQDYHQSNACFLKKIPILGSLFCSKHNRDDHTELVVLITPHLSQSMQKLGARKQLDPSYTNAANAAPVLALGEALPWEPETTVTGFGAIEANGRGVGAIGLSLSDGSTAILLIDNNGLSEAFRTGRDYGQGEVASIFFFNGALSNINAQGEFAVIVGLQGGGSAIYRIQGDSPRNAADLYWRDY